MGWNGGSEVFDSVMKHVCVDGEVDKASLIKEFAKCLEYMDAELCESEYRYHNIVIDTIGDDRYDE